MIKVRDTVKVIGKTVSGIEEKECIKIGTICDVVATYDDPDVGRIVGIIPKDSKGCEYWYLEKDVEKGHIEWVKDE